MSHDKIGPKERQRREMRERNYEDSIRGMKAPIKRPSATDLRKKVAAIKPAVKGQSGRRGR